MQTDQMDSLFSVSTSQSNNTAKSTHEDALMATLTEDADQDSSIRESSSLSRTDNQEQQSSSSIDDISRRAQDLVEKINIRRINDQKLMDDFQEKLVEKVTEMCQHMKEHMYTVYEVNSNEMQVKLQELSEVLENCAKLNKELMEARQGLATLTESLASNQTSEL